MERHKKHTGLGLIISAFLCFLAIAFDKRLEIIEFLQTYLDAIVDSIQIFGILFIIYQNAIKR